MTEKLAPIFQRMTEQEIASIQVIVFDIVDPAPYPTNSQQLCEAGCGRTIVKLIGVPEHPRKVCTVCGEWLSSPMSRA